MCQIEVFQFDFAYFDYKLKNKCSLQNKNWLAATFQEEIGEKLQEILEPGKDVIKLNYPESLSLDQIQVFINHDRSNILFSQSNDRFFIRADVDREFFSQMRLQHLSK